MRKGIIAGIWAAAFVLLCFIVVNAISIRVAHLYQTPFGGYPLPCYDNYIGIAAIDYKAAVINYFIAISVAIHVALGVFALFNLKAIFRWVFKVK